MRIETERLLIRSPKWARLLHIHSGNGKARATVELAPMSELRRKQRA